MLLPVTVTAAPRCLVCHVAHLESSRGCVDCHGGDPRTERREIAHAGMIAGRFAHFSVDGSPLLKRGVKRMVDAGCRRCHLSGGKGNRLAASLDRPLAALRPEEHLAAIRKPVLFMPDFRYNEEQGVELVNAIFAGAARTPVAPGERPLVVHFEESAAAEDLFSKRCGICHRILTSRRGGLGRGSVAPNLSGLFTEHYPGVYGEEERWTPENLEKWMKNPRRQRKNAVMPPVLLAPEDRMKLLEILKD